MATPPLIATSEMRGNDLPQQPSSPTAESSITSTDGSDFSDNSFAVIDNQRSPRSSQRARETDGAFVANSSVLTRHAELYMDEGMVEIQVQTTLYRVPAYALVRDSEYFRTLLKGHRPTSDSELVHVDDDDVTSVDFERFLLLLYPRLIGDFAAKTCEEWTSVLHLATKWGFTAIRELAIKQVFPLASDIDRIVLGRKYGLDGWLLDAFVSVCSRPKPLCLAEARRMSLEDVVRIGQGYAAIRPDANIMEPTCARETIDELVEITSEVIDLKQASDVETSLPAPMNIIQTHGSLIISNDALENVETSLNHTTAPTVPLSDNVLKFASLLTACEEELENTYKTLQAYPSYNPYIESHTAKQHLMAQKLKDLFASCVRDSVDLKHCIELIVNDGIHNSKDPVSFSNVLAQVCQAIPGLTSSTIEATIKHRHLTGSALASHYLYDALLSDIMSWTQPDEPYAYAPDAKVLTRQKQTIRFLQELDKLNAVPDGVAALCCQQLLACEKKVTDGTQATQLIEFLRLAGNLIDTPEADTRAALDDVFARLGHLRLNPCFHSVHKSITSLIELRQNGWST